MKSAGEVLVLDTENSRNSIGVFTEAFQFAKYTFKTTQEIIDENTALLPQVRQTLENTSFGLSNDQELINNTVKYYQKHIDSNLNRQQVLQKVRTDYGIDLTNYITESSVKAGKTAYLNYLLNNEGLTPYAINQKLTSNLRYLKESPVINILAPPVGMSILTNFGICPVYKIPIRLCPICSKWK
jgi:hypothetical protein